MAPEIIEGKPYDPFKADIFSLGIIFFMMITKKTLFEKAIYSDKKYNLYVKNPQLYWKFFKEAYPDINLSDSFILLIMRMTSKDPIKRYSIKEVISSEWLNR